VADLRYVNAYDVDIARLCENGYVEVTTTPAQPGQFQVVDRDVAPGWAEWWYVLDVYEHPDHPLSELGWGEPPR
jgi:hypothetical protein